MTREFESAIDQVNDALENLLDRADGMRKLEIVFSLERIAGKANEMIQDLQYGIEKQDNVRDVPGRYNYGSA